jgi:integration host factor subunit alpha
MTKADIVERVSERCGIPKKDSIEMVESVFNILKDTLENGEEIKISGFGKFEVKSKHARKGRNPQTGDAITIEARRILTFKPSTILKYNINSK